MPGTRSLTLVLVLAAVAAAGAAGFFLLRGEPDPAPRPPGPAAGAEEGTAAKEPGPAAPVAPVPPAEESGDDEEDDSDLDRDPTGEIGGATTEEILAAAAAGNWLEVERLLSAGGGSSDPRVTELLLKTLADGRWRYKAADLARYLKDPGALSRFLDVAKGEGDENTRGAALLASATLGGAQVAPAAIDILRNAKPGGILAEKAASALGAIGTPETARVLVDMLRASLGTPQAPIFLQSLARVQGAEALADLGRMASDEGIDARLRESLVAALGRTRNAAVVPDLLRLAKESEAPEVRHAALGALGMVGSPEGVQELLNVVQGGSAEDRAVAATALQGVKNKSAGPLLEQALQGSLPPELKGHVVAALGSAGGKSSLELLGKMARDGGEAPGLRGAAVRAIGEIGDSAGAAAVLDVLEGTPRTEASLRRQCATALQSVATSADLPRIDKILRGVPENTSEWYVLRGLSEALRTGRPEGVIRR